MKVGVDGRKLPGAARRTAVENLDYAAELGMDGVFFRTVLDITPTLDRQVLKELRQRADERELYLEMGLAKVNPYANAEAPEVRELGDGDYRLGMIRMMEACTEIGCNELWVGTANYKPRLPGYFVFDRFRTDVSWTEQLTATERFLGSLAPVARDLGCHLNVETHEEITSFEVVNIVEAIGPDAIGVTFDPANVVARAEDPLAAARRVAPYVRMSHVRDVAMFTTDYGIGRMLAPCGEGVMDWPAILAALAEYRPELQLSIENSRDRTIMPIHVYDPTWLAAHPDLTTAELAEIFRLTREYERRAAEGERPSVTHLTGTPCDEAEQSRFITETAAYLRDVAESLGAGGVRR
ncbi:sugar phosphate isomerase/epimerase family protein [Rhodococcus sp. JS3073]|uniref:sugar phosphate isomerase/epimerase family protein n=1 Tax=Rhodococcus sp. JS3073 TaxID=3002901 RepID=UPI0022869418|nr:sugar phosphate isomerase/epimerase family protein [Rhodococcus sp. JS3073]WAM18974.1 sugar phosphate isomerase/epimerase [Rhodococcus sp. JS3073]